MLNLILKKTKMCIFVIMMALTSLEEVLQRWILALWCTTMEFSTMVHNHEILEHHSRFLITHCYQDALEKWDDYDLDVHCAIFLIKYCYEDAIKWDDYDPNLHFANGYIMWDTPKAKLYYDPREKASEKIIPEQPVQKYKESIVQSQIWGQRLSIQRR